MTKRALKEKILNQLQKMEFSEEIFIDVFKFQYKNNEVYKKFCERESKTPENVKEIKDIPLMPVRFFKKYEIKSFKGKPKLLFISSGTSEGVRSKSFYKDIEFINKSILTSFEYFILPDNIKGNFYIFFEPFSIRKNSSLSYMLSLVSKKFSNKTFFVYKRSQYEDILKKLKKEKKPVLILGTTISLYDYMSFLKEKNEFLFLEKGSRIMDTGGWKGRRIKINEKKFLNLYEKYFDISENYVVNEYGMCELASQFYDITLRKFILENKKERYKFSLPFLKYRIINWEGKDDNEGLLGIMDLFNIDTCSFLLTPDYVKKKKKGFVIMGRVDKELRGCSLISEEVLITH